MTKWANGQFNKQTKGMAAKGKLQFTEIPNRMNIFSDYTSVKIILLVPEQHVLR